MKVIGIFTEDFRFFYEVVQRLKERGEAFVSLGKEGKVPPSVGVVITTSAEKHKVHFPKVVDHPDPQTAIDLAKCMLAGGVHYRTIIVGIDPGKSTGIAVFGEGKLLSVDTASSPERVPEAVVRLLSCLKYDRSLARIGHGDPTRRDRIIRAIWDAMDEVEMVDETGTSARSDRSDIDAAKRIAMTRGERVKTSPKVRPTPGELRDIQRLSRIESEGTVTISSDLASQVAIGEISMPQAVQSQRKKPRPSDE